MNGTVIALMVIISVNSSHTPPEIKDRVRVMVSPYPSLQACIDELAHNPLSQEEVQTERKYAIKTLRSCTKLEQTDYRYYWDSKEFVDWLGMT